MINGVSLYWEKAYATSYQVQVSIDQTTWTSISSTTTGVGGNTILIGLAGIGHYLRVYATRYSPGHRSFSLEEVQVYGNGAGPQGPTGATGLKDQQALQVPQDLKVCPRLFVPSLAQVLHPTVIPMVLRQGQVAICGLLL